MQNFNLQSINIIQYITTTKLARIKNENIIIRYDNKDKNNYIMTYLSLYLSSLSFLYFPFNFIQEQVQSFLIVISISISITIILPYVISFRLLS